MVPFTPFCQQAAMTKPDPTPILHDYQQADFDEIMLRFERGDTHIACEWDPGLGKSLLTIMLARALGARRVLVQCPSIALVSWTQQLEMWWPSAPAVFISASKHASRVKPDTRVVVVTHDLLRNDDLRATLREWARDGFGVIDEAQYLRGHDTQRTGASYGRGEGVMSYVSRVVLLSGTFVVSWPDDLWTHLARWAPERIMLDGRRMDYVTFRDHFLMTRQVPIPGAFIKRTQIYGMTPEKQADLRDRLKGWKIKRTKSETNLPPLTWRDMPLELTAADRKQIETELNDHMPPRLQTLAMRAARDPDNAALAQQFMDAMAEYSELMPVAMRVLGVGKAKALCRVLRERLENSRQAIGIFAVNHAVMDIIDTELKSFGVLRIDGSTSLKRRGDAVDQFMQPDGPRVFNGQVQACGTALTLVRANQCFFAQQSWIPGENFQAASRFHRIGQNNPVDAYVPFVRGTLDQPMMQVLRKKNIAASSTNA